MTTPRFAARKVGDHYEFHRQDLPGRAGDIGCQVGGGLLVVLGLWQRGLVGTLAAATGAGLLYRAYTGRSPWSLVVSRRRRFDHSPSYQNDDVPRSTSQQASEDEVDEASMESFPASDPPARHGT